MFAADAHPYVLIYLFALLILGGALAICWKPRNRPFILLILLAFLVDAHALTICSYEGPDISEHGLELTNFSISASESTLAIDDVVQVIFYLRNTGNESLNLTDRGMFAAVRDRDGNNRDFGFREPNRLLEAGEQVKFQRSTLIETSGRWSIWPSYEIWRTAYSPALRHDITMRAGGPVNWHTCQVAACPSYCENGTRHHYSYLGQSGECVYENESCPYGCNEGGSDCANVTRVEIEEGPEVEDQGYGCEIAAWVTWRQNVAGEGTLFYREALSFEWMTSNSTGNGTRHSILAAGVRPGKTYYYHIRACGPDDCIDSPMQEFTFANKLSFTNVRTTVTEATATVKWETRCRREGTAEAYWYGEQTNYSLHVVPTAYAGFANPPWSIVSNSSYGWNHTALLSGMLEDGRN